MPDQVSVSVKSDLLRIVDDLTKIAEAQERVTQGFKEGSETVGDTVTKHNKKMQDGMEKTKSFGRRLAEQLKKDFQGLLSINALAGSLKLSEQFRGTLKETVSLSDAIRKMGGTFGIAQQNFSRFQTSMVRGMGEIGLSSEAAARVLEGLVATPVRGEENLVAYARTAGQLASIGGQKGREGEVAGSIARLIQARGGDPNDTGQVAAVAEDVRRARNVSGKGPAELLKGMEDLFTNMSEDFRKKISSRGLATLAGAGAAAGPNATSFIQEFLKLSEVQRAGIEARTGQIFGEQGVNTDAVQQLFQEAKRLGGGDVRLGVKAATGIESDEAAEGFIRLAESLDKVKMAQRGIQQATGSLEEQYRSSQTMSEAFQSSLNRVKKVLAAPLSSITQKGTDLLSGAAQSDAGAAAVTGGAAVAAALLAGGGLRGVGGGMLGGMAKGAAIEAITGEEVQKVEVINWPAGGLGGMGGAGGMLAKAGAVGAVGMAGVAAGTALNSVIQSHTQGRTSEGFEGNAVERLMFKLDKLIGGSGAEGIMAAHKVQVAVELKSRDLKPVKPPGRGASH